MKKEKKPHITLWVVITVLSVNQAIMAHQMIQEKQARQELWDSLLGMQRSWNQSLKEQIQYLEKFQNSSKKISQYLEELYK